jgi:tetratricopeptide (TPR) repeat protein
MILNGVFLIWDIASKLNKITGRIYLLNPGYGPARNLLALLWLRARQPQKALEQAEAALKISPDDDVALYHEIMARRNMGQTQQVKDLVGKLALLRKENAEKKRATRRYVLQEDPGS